MKNNQENIAAELKQLGVLLEHKPNTHLQVPSGYFEQSKQEILNTVLALDFVAKLPKTMPQEVPAGYFEESKLAILASVQPEDSFQHLSGRRTIRKNWALAATMALLISLGLFFINPAVKNGASIESQLSSLSADQINGYIQENAYDFEALDILENPQITTKELEDLEAEILNATKSMSDEEIFVYAL